MSQTIAVIADAVFVADWKADLEAFGWGVEWWSLQYQVHQNIPRLIEAQMLDPNKDASKKMVSYLRMF